MPGRLGFTILDNTGEKSSTGMYTGEVTAASLPGLLGEVGPLRNAIDGMILGTIAKESLSVFDTVLSNTRPANTFAQRENKWLVVYEDNQPFFDPPTNAIPNEGYGRKFSIELATADLALLPDGQETVPLGDTEAAALVAAMEQTLRSPNGGTINVLEIRFVGRKS